MPKKTHEQYIEDLHQVSPTIIVNGIYDGKEKPITVMCSVCGYEWNPRAGTLLRGYGCPNCAGNAPKTTEQFVSELKQLNNDITVLGNYTGANKTIRVRCNVCGTEWTPTPSKLLLGRGCPECAKSIVTRKRIDRFIEKDGSLSDIRPDLLKEWNYELNSQRQLDPCRLTQKSNSIAAWICSKCGYKYDAMISNRTQNGSGCPVCAGKTVIQGINDLTTVAPELMEDWDYEKNQNDMLFPTSVSKGSVALAHWKCKTCGFCWQATVYSRIAGSGCPRCAKEEHTSFPEQTIFFYIKQIIPNAINTFQPRWLKPSEIDIFLPDFNFGIEYDGEGFHTDAIKDENKDVLCREHGITLLHVREPKCPIMKSDSLIYRRSSKKEKDLDEVVLSVVRIINERCGSSFAISPSVKRDRDVIYNQYLSRKKQNSIAMCSDAMQDWDWKKNHLLNPEMISRGSNIKVWWKCHICGNETYAMVSSHQTHKCAVCRQKNQNPEVREQIVTTGKKDVQSLFPDLAQEWLVELNNGVSPSDLSYGSTKKITWKCKKCGYVWSSKICNRTKGQGCPKCARRAVIKGENDLATMFPALVEQWVECIEVPSLSPESVSSSSNLHVKWRCPVCKGEWIVSVSSRTRDNKIHGCPYCLNEKVLPGFNDLKTLSPEIAQEWDTSKNGDQTPETTLNKSGHRVWWLCSKCGCSWFTSVVSRTGTQHSGCPECAKKSAGSCFKKRIRQYSLEGEFIAEYDSLTKAAKTVGLSSSSICTALKREKGTSGGYRWKYAEDNIERNL